MRTKKRQLSQTNAGFTLIEVLVVVMIVGTLAGIAAPGWLGYLNRQRVSSVRSELKVILQEAQTNAQQKSTSYGVVLGTSDDGPTAALSTAGNTHTTIVLGDNASSVDLMAFISTTTTAEILTFNYRGDVSEDLLPFVIKVISDNDTSTQKCLIVSSLLGGIVEAQDTACDNPNLGT